MPLLYGEGNKAFERLQAKIASRFEDESIFAFIPMHNSPTFRHENLFSMFAVSPADFATCGHIRKHRYHSRPPYASTNRGIQIRIPAEVKSEDANPLWGAKHGAYRSRSNPDRVVLVLNCSRFADPLRRPSPALTRLSVDGKDLPGPLRSITLLQLSCSHYGRESETVADFQDLMPLTEEEVLYVHRRFSDVYACLVLDGGDAQKRQRRLRAKL
ncbi:hypothetical protein LTR65_008016 [Meristemomyces frigidus]